jgi:tetratricopeptide (TPR) repeat protein
MPPTQPDPQAASRDILDLLQQGAFADAEARLQALDAAGVDDPQLTYLRGLTALTQDRDEEACTHLERAAAALPGHAVVIGNLGLCRARLGRHAQALEALDSAVRLAPRHADFHYNRGLALFALNRLQEASASFRSAVELRPDHLAAWTALGETQHALGRYLEADIAYQRAADRSPDDPLLAVRQASLLYDAGSYPAALAAADRALARDPTLAVAWRERAGALRRLDRLQEAESAIAEALRLDPYDADALKSRGLIRQMRDDLAGAASDFTQAARAHFRPGSVAPATRDFRRGSRAKLRHDIEQFRHLQQQGLLADAERLADLHQRALVALGEDGADGQVVDLTGTALDLLRHDYNRLHHLAAAPRLADGALNPDLDPAAIESDYYGRGPGITWIDGLLRPEALAALRRYCLDSTFWFDFHHVNGYVGAYFETGFAAPLLLQIAEELRERLPRIFSGHKLTQLWAYKYDSRLDGIEMHADIAAVNLNFWITPDEANLDAESGGLVVWDKEAPPHWSFDEFNTSTEAGQARIRKFLDDSGARMIRVPHRQNRAVLFNSDLFHRTDRIRFREGYENRRINITMLMGQRSGKVR